jgi:hypothetical protein
MFDRDEGDAAGDCKSDQGEGDELAHEWDSVSGGEVSAAVAGARYGGGRPFEAVDGDTAGESHRDQGEGEQFAHGRSVLRQ